MQAKYWTIPFRVNLLGIVYMKGSEMDLVIYKHLRKEG